MLYCFKILIFLINFDQQPTVFNWFEIKQGISIEYSLVIKTFKLIEELSNKVQSGLTLSDIETILFFILFIRFIVLTIRFNLKTSFYISCIGLFAGYLWYRHLIDLISMYRSILIKLPYLHKLGIDAVQLRTINRQLVLTDLKIGDNVHWYNPIQLLYYAIIRGITNFDVETGFKYYIDPISMIISNLKESDQAKILPLYYKIYNKIIPQLIEAISKFWTQLSGIAAYAVITRIGKRYCPYLVRWHWTFLLIIGFIEQILVYFVYRISYFQATVLLPQTQISSIYRDQNLILQINTLNGLIAFIVFFHIGLVFFGLLHAISGQYFYFPFIVENTELHIGPRPITSIYSGGKTAWQTDKEKNTQRIFPKLWYGWFGRGTTNNENFFSFLKKVNKSMIKKLRKFIGK